MTTLGRPCVLISLLTSIQIQLNFLLALNINTMLLAMKHKFIHLNGVVFFTKKTFFFLNANIQIQPNSQQPWLVCLSFTEFCYSLHILRIQTKETENGQLIWFHTIYIWVHVYLVWQKVGRTNNSITHSNWFPSLTVSCIVNSKPPDFQYVSCIQVTAKCSTASLWKTLRYEYTFWKMTRFFTSDDKLVSR